MVGKSCGKQRTQYAVDAAPSVAKATSARPSTTPTDRVWVGVGVVTTGWLKLATAPGDAAIETTRTFVPATQGT